MNLIKIPIEMVERDDGWQLRWVTPVPSVEVLDTLISLLGREREKAQPPVPMQPPALGSRVAFYVDQPVIGGFGLAGRAELSVRHPGYGWLHFRLHDEDRTDLLRDLAADPMTRPTKPN